MMKGDNRKRSLEMSVTMTTASPGLLLLVAFLLSMPMQSSAFSTLSSGSLRTSNSRLGFRNGDEVDAKYQQKLGSSNTDEPAAANKWWVGLRHKPVAPKTEEEEASERVEEYLKFLDKRYSQIHEKDEQPTRSNDLATPPTFSVMRWLQKEPVQSSDSDALFALGVAAKQADAALGNNLHSQQQATLKESEATTMKVTEGERVVSSALESAIEGLKRSPVFLRIVRSRRALLKYETVKAQQLMRAMAGLLRKLPQAPVKLIKAGGGQKPMAVAFGVLSVMLIHVLVPAVGSFVKESLATQA